MTAQDFDDVGSQSSSVLGRSESNLNVPADETLKRTTRDLRSSESRQQEMADLINDSLQMLKTKQWNEVSLADKHVILGLFAVVGGWQGFSRAVVGSAVQVETSNGYWSAATVIDDGVGKGKVQVILDEDTDLQLVKVPHHKVRLLQVNIDKSINDKINFDDLCQAITFLHSQLADKKNSAQKLKESD